MKILALPWKLGQKKHGVEKGAISLLYMFLSKNPNLDYTVLDNKNFKNCDYHKSVFDYKKKINQNCCVLGGDHSIAIGSVLSSLNSNYNTKNIGVLWIDAHPDINTIDSSETKNIHGMPLSFITGLEKSWDWTKNLKKLDFNDLHYWGIRDIDLFEKQIISKTNKINNVNQVKKLVDKYDYLHISFDIDGIDPIYTPSTGTPVKNGLKLDDIENMFNYLIKSEKKFTIDIVEYNPDIGSKKDKITTWNNLNNLINVLI